LKHEVPDCISCTDLSDFVTVEPVERLPVLQKNMHPTGRELCAIVLDFSIDFLLLKSGTCIKLKPKLIHFNLQMKGGR